MNDLLGVATAGGIAGFAKTIVAHPMDTMKVHLQNRMSPPRTIAGLYRGITVPFIRNGIEHSTHFFFRGLVANALAVFELPGRDNPFFVGFLAGIPQSLVNTPMDYTRLQLQLKKPVVIRSLYRGLPWVVMKESASGMIFYGIYEGARSLSIPAGFAGVISALSAMTMTYPIDVFKTRVQAGGSFSSAVKMKSFGSGLEWAVGKCIVANFVALTVYEAACIVLAAQQPVHRKHKSDEAQ
ncbi:hypothetical protein CYMTET_7155 [Cymbomonas tetramitiformis]|uniref:Mitochondrial carrier protein n=1 Tax=Cymbomonas tetramitiformis TaxID=36881 RepID=A0AAE0GVZ6_9CHLO|nr:hypothetical protein CYMTET_7155 [Cymbomonas tetramitiformis]